MHAGGDEFIIFTLIDEVNVDGFPPPTSEDGVFPSDFLLGSLKVFFQRQKLSQASRAVIFGARS